MSANEASLSTLIQRVEALSDAAGDMLDAVRESGSLEAHTRAAAEAVNLHKGETAAHAALFSAQAKAFEAKIRNRLTSDLTLYVAPDGNDNNDGDTLQKPLKTSQGVLNRLHGIDGAGFRTTILFAPGVYGHLKLNAMALNTLIAIGGLDPDNKASLAGVRARGCEAASVIVYNLKISNFISGSVTVNGIDFEIAEGAEGAYHGLYADQPGDFIHAYNCTFKNEASIEPFAVSANAGYIRLWESCKFIGSPAYAKAALYAINGGVISPDMVTSWEGVPQGHKWLAKYGGGVFTGARGPDFVPGALPGVTDSATGGYYA